MKRKLTPEQRERIARTLEEGERAREHLRQILERQEARRQAYVAARERRRRRVRRILRLGRA